MFKKESLLTLLSLNTTEALVSRAKNGDNKALNQLIEQNKDLLSAKSFIFRKAPIPGAAIEGEAMRLLLVAVNRYDPNSTANFRTYLEHTLRGLNRYVNSNKNIARIPENRLAQIRHFETIKSLLRTDRGRDPTIDELSDELGWSMPEVAAMNKSLKQKDLSEMSFISEDAATRVSSRLTETGELLYVTLLPEEKLVYDYLLGAHGKPKLSSVFTIARKTKLSTDKVYRVRRDISRKLNTYI